ncbi:hypothetical protein LO763_26630 [Glycomyces sp. A-F 0318]|uniref:hypothetical protein n=1 Tax=Glycomyces amatae TaxID=2881355 RepID=UPI001E4DA6C0|nr:hypothetical protein [Glycomyces amatae]MCD0447197.1 hypothetical protein [Glycomyces amatae]
METLRRAIEDYLYGLDDTLDLSMVAAHALVRDIDSQALAELAGLSTGSEYEFRELVPTVVEELSVELSPLPEAVFRKAGEVARAFQAGDLDFLTAARRVTNLMFDSDYLDFEERPDVGLKVFDNLWLLNEWVFAIDYGAEEDGWYCFKTREDAESYFETVASALVGPGS